MWWSSLDLHNVRGFSGRHLLDFARNLNIFVGPNNAGKTTLLNALLLPQTPSALTPKDVSMGQRANASVQIGFVEPSDRFSAANNLDARKSHTVMRFELIVGGGSNHSLRPGPGLQGQSFALNLLDGVEPYNVIYPYFSKRKVTNYTEDVRLQFSNAVTGTLEHLTAKVDRISNPTFLPAHDEYVTACDEILGFQVSAVGSPNGKKAAYTIRNFENIQISSMGEGVPNLLGLIVDLCTGEEGKIFIIEEPENDIHPKALRALLKLIERKSENNQFFISTHSNIVTKQLGSVEKAKVFRVSMSFDERRFPRSTVTEVPSEETARRELLEELGYEFQDHDLHKAWLFLEESSAEVVIRDFLIPQFVHKLVGKLKTFSARGVDDIEAKFDNFNRLFVFLHLQPVYKNLVWVYVDAGARENEIIDKMRTMYSKSGWNEEQFSQFSEHDFERYYPKSFQDKVDAVLSLTDKGKKRKAKAELVEELKIWWQTDPDGAKKEFAESAKEVIDVLKMLAKSIV